MEESLVSGRCGKLIGLLTICMELADRRTPMTQYDVADRLGVGKRTAHRYLWALCVCGLAEPDTFELHPQRPWQWVATPMLIERIGRR